MPSQPVLSEIDPDAFGMLCRNLMENALKHGAPNSPIEVRFSPDGRLSVANEGPVVMPDALARLTSRFEKGAGCGDGSGLGLAIVRTIAERVDGTLTLNSPIAGRGTGFEAVVVIPLASRGLDQVDRPTSR